MESSCVAYVIFLALVAVVFFGHRSLYLVVAAFRLPSTLQLSILFQVMKGMGKLEASASPAEVSVRERMSLPTM